MGALAEQQALDADAVDAAVAAVMTSFSFCTLIKPENLEARLRLAAADAVRRVRQSEGGRS